MISTILNGSFGLDKIKRIRFRNSRYQQYYLIELVNDDRQLCVSDFHAFKTDENKAKLVSELKNGDNIWIDISAFTSDGTLKDINNLKTKK